MENSIGLTVENKMANGKTIKDMEKVLKFGQITQDKKENGLRIQNMGLVDLNGLMDPYKKVILSTMQKTERGHLHGVVRIKNQIILKLETG